VEGQKHQITFQSLKDIFSSTPQDVLGEERARQIQMPALNHYLNTRILTQTEFCRQAMTLSYQRDRRTLSSLI
jgi:hypothetical protein